MNNGDQSASSLTFIAISSSITAADGPVNFKADAVMLWPFFVFLEEDTETHSDEHKYGQLDHA